MRMLIGMFSGKVEQGVELEGSEESTPTGKYVNCMQPTTGREPVGSWKCNAAKIKGFKIK